MREHNLALVLSRIVEADAPPTRAQIAQGTGLTRATVSDLVETLVDAELVTELAPRAGERAGRPGVPLAPARRTVVGVGAEVAVDHLGVTVVDLTGMSVTQRIVEGDFRLSRSDKVLDRLGRLLASVVTEVKAQGMRPAGVCLAVPGL
ncbi:MAG TPA: MarR family transcriptional regulator, partial [Phycicoccus sp.]|nr:MarR family transcriptional regulator [Phycicoccus sp.]